SRCYTPALAFWISGSYATRPAVQPKIRAADALHVDTGFGQAVASAKYTCYSFVLCSGGHKGSPLSSNRRSKKGRFAKFEICSIISGSTHKACGAGQGEAV